VDTRTRKRPGAFADHLPARVSRGLGRKLGPRADLGHCPGKKQAETNGQSLPLAHGVLPGEAVVDNTREEALDLGLHYEWCRVAKMMGGPRGTEERPGGRETREGWSDSHQEWLWQVHAGHRLLG
jgi:hypothetical protein